MSQPTTLAEVYEHEYERLYRRAYCLLRQRDDAHDVTQDTFVKALHALTRMPLPENPYPWLYRIVSNTAYDVLRRRRLVSWETLDRCHDAVLAVSTSDPQEHVPCQDHVRRVLAQLPVRSQHALVMQGVHGSSLQEIAQTLGLKPGGAKSYLSRARQAFRQASAQQEAPKEVRS